jgi:hypothetical protein
MSTKVLNVRISSALHKELKIQSALMEQNIKDLVEQAIKDFLQKVKNTEEDKKWNNFIRVHDKAEKEEPSPEDIEAIDRGRKEIENGEVEDFEVKAKNMSGTENNIVSSVNNWLDKLQEKKNRGLFDITKDPLYNIPAFDFDAPADFAQNIDNYIYGEGE